MLGCHAIPLFVLSFFFSCSCIYFYFLLLYYIGFLCFAFRGKRKGKKDIKKKMFFFLSHLH